MARTQRDRRPREAQEGQVSFLAPDNAAVLRLVERNLQLLAELRTGYLTRVPHTSTSRQMRCPQDVFDLLSPEMEDLPQEQLRVLLLNTRNRVLDAVLVYQGNVHTAIVRMAEVFREAIIANAPAIILSHNHPSGDPEGSPDDVRLTKEAIEAGKLLDIDVLDHIVIGHGRFTSLKQLGVL